MNLGVAICIALASVLTIIGSVYDMWDKSRWALSDVWLIMIGGSVSLMFIIGQLLGVK